MKGVPGLLIALGLGIAGAFCNWLYLAQKGLALERVEFIGIREGTQINPGDKFNEGHFTRISIPKNAVGNLEKAAFQWGELQTVVGMAATKSYSPGEVLLRQDLKTLPENDIKKLLAPYERVMWLPVDTRGFVASLVAAGDQVSFIVPNSTPAPAAAPALASGDGTTSGTAAPVVPPGPKIIGPYRILALGNRLGSREVLQAAGMSASQENIMAVAVRIVEGGGLDEAGQQLADLKQAGNFQQVQVLLHPATEGKVK